MSALMRQDRDALDAAEQAAKRLSDATGADDRLWIDAVVAEARHDAATAGERYRLLVSRHENEPAALLELAGFLDRADSAKEAVETYHRALSLDGDLIAAHLELCRLYSPSRLNEPELAKTHGQRTLVLARDLKNSAWEARALMCLADVLRSGSDVERTDARRNAEEALRIVERLRYRLGTALALNYVSIVTLLAERDARRAAPLLERALAAAREVGFVRLEMRVMMNLAVAREALGDRKLALEAYGAGLKLAEDARSQQDAAYNQINAAAIVIDYGTEPDAGLRDAENALGVFQDADEREFEAYARSVIASYYRHTGRYEEAARHVNLGLDVARNRGLAERVDRLTLELARVHFDQGQYDAARNLFGETARTGAGLNRVQATVGLGRTMVRLGDFDAARRTLMEAAAEVERTGDLGSSPLVDAAFGELEYEAGRLSEARARFVRSSSVWSAAGYPEDASVEARAYVGLLDGLRGETARGRSVILESLERARMARRVEIQARCQIFLARVALKEGKARESAQALAAILSDQTRPLRAELQAEAHYWHGEALTRAGDRERAAAERSTARDLLQSWRSTLSSPYNSAVRNRRDLRLIMSGEAAERP